MPNLDPDDPDSDLLPPGSRWGAGAESVLPYLARSLQARPIALPEQQGMQPGDVAPPSGHWPPAAAH